MADRSIVDMNASWASELDDSALKQVLDSYVRISAGAKK
jgi:hypothetical protein